MSNDGIMINEILTITMTLFAVIDIFGSIPIVLDLREKAGKIESLKATLISFFIMVLFLFTGEAALSFLGIDVASFSIAGGLILFFMGLELVLGLTFFKSEPDTEGSSIVPLAFPLIAGPGSLTTIISLNSLYPFYTILIGIVLNLIVVYITLKFSNKLSKILGKNGMMVLRKVFGIICLAIAIKMIKFNLFL
jgi:multiple antibiotic resistance protein|tara:strand:+ start:510 stop:1088 length:579 start_codon:yes stop_codon:yes gene_type:complete